MLPCDAGREAIMIEWPEKAQVTNTFKWYDINTAAIQEIIWTGSGILSSNGYELFYSGGETQQNETGFLVDIKRKGMVLNFESINERLCKLRIKSHFFNVSLFSTWASTEEGLDEVKD